MPTLFASLESGEESEVEGVNMGTQKEVTAGPHKGEFILEWILAECSTGPLEWYSTGGRQTSRLDGVQLIPKYYGAYQMRHVWALWINVVGGYHTLRQTVEWHMKE